VSFTLFLRSAVCASALLFVLPHASPAGAQSQMLIRLGVGWGDTSSEAYDAQQMGFFKRAGLNVELRPFRTGATIATGVAAGSIDIGISNVPALARDISRGSPLVFIAGAGLYSSSDAISALCVPERSSVHAANDFLGKTIAVAALGDQSYLSTLSWLDQNHVDTTNVHFIALPYTDMASGIENGLADAALITEPWLSASVHHDKLRLLARQYDAVAPVFLIGVWFTSSRWYREHPEAASRFVKAIYEAARWANAHHEQSAKLLAQTSRIDLPTIRSMARVPFSTSLDPAMLQPPLDLAFKYHESERPLNARSLIVQVLR
jgi:NitT/TauT family transport system substrate-binding protein